MARNVIDDQHGELVGILDELLASDVDISAREVARRHPALSSASTITRHAERRRMLEEYQNRQVELRRWRGRVTKTSKDETVLKIATQEARITDLERTVQALTEGHLALITVVAQVGGMAKLAKYYEQFRDVRNRLYDTGAMAQDLPSPTLLRPKAKDQ